MQQYKNLLRDIMTNGRRRGDRTGTGTLSVFGRQLVFDLQEGFPLVTLKRTPMRPIVAELIWFLEGSTNNERLRQLTGTKEGQRGIWDQWALTEDYVREHPVVSFEGKEVVDMRRVDDLGPIYGAQWRDWRWLADIGDPYQCICDVQQVDQITALINGLKYNPYSRRHIVSAWNVKDLPDETKSPQQNVLEHRMSLAPCHPFWQCYVRDMTLDERLDYYNENKASAGMKLGKPDDIDEEGTMEMLTKMGVPARFLDLHLYMRKDNCALAA